jgi:hypothetical protein
MISDNSQPNETSFAIELASVSLKRRTIEELKMQFAGLNNDLQALIPDLDVDVLYQIISEYELTFEPRINELTFELDKLKYMLKKNQLQLSLKDIEFLQDLREAMRDKELQDITGTIFVEDLDEDQQRDLRKRYRKLAALLHPDKNELDGKFFNLMEQLKITRDLTNMILLDELLIDLIANNEELNSTTLAKVFDQIEGRGVDGDLTSSGLSTQIVVLKNNILVLQKIKSIALDLRGQDLTVDLQLIRVSALTKISDLETEIELIKSLLSESSVKTVGNGEIVISNVDPQSNHKSIDFPASFEAMELKLLAFEDYVLGLVNKGLMFTDDLTGVQDDFKSSFVYYRGIVNQTPFEIEIYNERGDTYRTYSLRLFSDIELDTQEIGEYWKFNQRSFGNLRMKTAYAFEFKARRYSEDLQFDGHYFDFVEINVHDIYVGYPNTDLKPIQDIYSELAQRLSGFEIFDDFFQSVTPEVDDNTSSLALVMNETGLTVAGSDLGNLRPTRKESMMTQAAEFAQFCHDNVVVTEVVLFGSLGKSDSPAYCNDIDMVVFSPSFGNRGSKTSRYSNGGNSNSMSACMKQLGKSNPRLDYTDGDFLPINSKFFTDPSYREGVVNDQDDRYFFSNVLSDCKVWDNANREFVQVDFEYFRSKYLLHEDSLIRESGLDDSPHYVGNDYYDEMCGF